MWEVLFFVLGLLHPPARTFCKPKGFHVAFTDTPSELSISWLTYFPQWGATFSYRALHCAPSDWRDLTPSATPTVNTFGYNRHVVNSVRVAGLSANCTYEYKAGFGLFWTQVFEVAGRTSYDALRPEDSDPDMEASLIVFGDMGSGSDSATTRAHIADFVKHNEVHAVVHSGDLAYNLRSPLPSFIRRYFGEVEEFASSIPYMAAAGNHEKYRNFTRYRELLLMPKNEYSGSSLYYSFNLGRAHFVIYCAEFLFLDMLESEQTHQNWLIADLHAANQHRDVTPWIILIGHRPLYCGIDWHRALLERYGFQSNFDCSFRASLVRTYMEDILNAAGVDLVLSSHVHNYERFASIYRNESTVPSDPHSMSDPPAPVYIVSGAAGNVEKNDPVTPTPDPWQLFASAELGFGRLLVVNATHLYWEQWDSTTRQRADYLWLDKTRPRYPFNASTFAYYCAHAVRSTSLAAYVLPQLVYCVYVIKPGHVYTPERGSKRSTDLLHALHRGIFPRSSPSATRSIRSSFDPLIFWSFSFSISFSSSVLFPPSVSQVFLKVRN